MAKGCVCFVTRKAARCVTQLYDENLRPTGLRSTQVAVLNTVRLLEPIKIIQLAEAMVLDRTTLARNLRPLERQGLVRIKPGKDLRERKVSITDKGTAKLEEAFPYWQEAQGRIEKELGQQGMATLRGALSGLVSLTRNQ
jgi:DNA-binding MarR family transcriptional regulator